jgi:hypothetical protein
MNKYDFKKLVTKTKNDRIQFSLILGTIGNIIGYSTRKYSHPSNVNKYMTEYMVFQFINQGGLSYFRMIDNIIASEVLFLFSVINSLGNNYLSNLKKNFIDTLKIIEQDKEDRNIDIITQTSIKVLINNKINNYDELAINGLPIIRTAPFGLIYDKIEDIVENSVQTISLTHQNGYTIIGGIAFALITLMAKNGVKIEGWIDKLIDQLENIKSILGKYKYGKLYLEENEKYIDKLRLYLERSQNKSNAMLYPHIRSDYYYRNFNNGKIYYIGNNPDDAIIMSYDCLLDCIIDGVPSYEKLVYTGIIHLGETSLTGFITSFWYGLYFGYTNDIPKNLFMNIENIMDILNMGEKVIA